MPLRFLLFQHILYKSILELSLTAIPVYILCPCRVLHSNIIYPLLLYNEKNTCQITFQSFYNSYFLTTQCMRIPFRISSFSTFKPAFLQQSVTTSLVAIVTSPCPHKFARGSSILSINHNNNLLSLVTSRSTSLPPGRRHLFTLSKNACGFG